MLVIDIIEQQNKITALLARMEAAEKEITYLRKLAKTGGRYDFAVEVTGYTRQTLYNKVSMGKIPYRVRMGKPWFDLEHLEKWMDDHRYNEEYWGKKVISELNAT